MQIIGVLKTIGTIIGFGVLWLLAVLFLIWLKDR